MMLLTYVNLGFNAFNAFSRRLAYQHTYLSSWKGARPPAEAFYINDEGCQLRPGKTRGLNLKCGFAPIFQSQSPKGPSTVENLQLGHLAALRLTHVKTRHVFSPMLVPDHSRLIRTLILERFNAAGIWEHLRQVQGS